MIRRLLDLLYKLSGFLSALFILGIVVIVSAQVCLNFINKISTAVFKQALGLTIPSYSDFTGFFLAASSFLALAYTLRSGGHIRVMLITGLLGKRAQRWLEGICLSLAGFMAGYASYYMVLLIGESFTFKDKTSGMVALPVWILQIPVAVGLIILTIAFIDEFVGFLQGKEPTYQNQGENLLSE